WALVGELSLGGEVRTVPGLLPMVAALVRRGVRRIIVPEDGLAEARLAATDQLIGVADLAAAVDALRTRRSRPRSSAPSRVELGGGAETGPATGSVMPPT